MAGKRWLNACIEQGTLFGIGINSSPCYDPDSNVLWGHRVMPTSQTSLSPVTGKPL